MPYSEYNEMTVALVKSFTEHALQKQAKSENKKFYGFNQLWELLQDREENIVPVPIQDLAFQSARHIVSNIPQSKAFLQTFFGKCFDLIREHKSVYQAISFAHYILDK
jgi:ubiquitin carboxyl-terminal hydrolase 9/24